MRFPEFRTAAARLAPIFAPTGALVAALGVLAVLLWLGGHDAGRAMTALWRGAFGSSYALMSGTLVRATPLIFAGLAVAIAFRAGVLNVGAEGQLLIGAAASAAVAVTWGPSLGRAGILVPLVAGAAFGGAWAGIAAALRRWFGVLDVISMIMLNFIALDIVAYLVRGPLQEPTHIYPQTSSIDLAMRLPHFGARSRLHAGFALALVACAVSWWILRATSAGFRLRMTGANPSAARVAGRVNTQRVTTMAFVASGALAGLAGAVQITGVTYALYENLSPGYGYTAIAVALLARLNPLGVALSGVLFGALEAGADAMQRDAGIPSVIVWVVEAVLILAVLTADYMRDRAAIARPFTGHAPVRQAGVT